MTVITYLDTIKDKEDKDEAFDQASWATGSSSERTFFIANYTHVDDEKSFEVDQTALDILDSVLLSAERFIRIRKQREKNQMERETMAGGKRFFKFYRIACKEDSLQTNFYAFSCGQRNNNAFVLININQRMQKNRTVFLQISSHCKFFEFPMSQ